MGTNGNKISTTTEVIASLSGESLGDDEFQDYICTYMPDLTTPTVGAGLANNLCCADKLGTKPALLTNNVQIDKIDRMVTGEAGQVSCES